MKRKVEKSHKCPNCGRYTVYLVENTEIYSCIACDDYVIDKIDFKKEKEFYDYKWDGLDG